MEIEAPTENGRHQKKPQFRHGKRRDHIWAYDGLIEDAPIRQRCDHKVLRADRATTDGSNLCPLCWFQCEISVSSFRVEVLKKQTSKLTRHRCEICIRRAAAGLLSAMRSGCTTNKTHTNSVRLIARCPMCHKSAHRLASVMASSKSPIHLMKVNQWPHIDC